MITLISNRGHSVRFRGFTRKAGYIEIYRGKLVDAGKHRGFGPQDYWQYAVTPEGEKLGIRGVV